MSYHQTPEGVKADSDSFFRMADYYIGFIKESFKSFYGKPEYERMNELLPEQVHLKMKLSMFVQVWLPYLTEKDAERFLKSSGFSLQYTELEMPSDEPVIVNIVMQRFIFLKVHLNCIVNPATKQ